MSLKEEEEKIKKQVYSSFPFFSHYYSLIFAVTPPKAWGSMAAILAQATTHTHTHRVRLVIISRGFLVFKTLHQTSIEVENRQLIRLSEAWNHFQAGIGKKRLPYQYVCV